MTEQVPPSRVGLYKLITFLAGLAAGITALALGHEQLGGLVILTTLGAPAAMAGVREVQRRKNGK